MAKEDFNVAEPIHIRPGFVDEKGPSKTDIKDFANENIRLLPNLPFGEIPAAPENVSAQIDPRGGITVSWTKNKQYGNIAYLLFRAKKESVTMHTKPDMGSEIPSGTVFQKIPKEEDILMPVSWEQLTRYPIKEAQYFDSSRILQEEPGVYCYKVQAVACYELEAQRHTVYTYGKYSNNVEVTVELMAAWIMLKAPENLRAFVCISKKAIRLDWDASENALSYDVYRNNPVYPIAEGIESTYFIDEDFEIEEGDTIHYWVSAVNGWGKGDTGELVFQVHIPLPAKPSISAESVESGIQISWNFDPNAEDCVITRITKPSQYSSKITKNISLPHYPTSYIDKNAEKLSVYTYSIIATNIWGQSPKSEKITAEWIYNGPYSPSVNKRALAICYLDPLNQKDNQWFYDYRNGAGPAGMLENVSDMFKSYGITTETLLNQSWSYIRLKILTFFQNQDDNDISFIFLCGHGTDDGNEIILGQSVSYSDIRDILDYINGTKIVIIQSCHSGGSIDISSNDLPQKRSLSSSSVSKDTCEQIIKAFMPQQKQARTGELRKQNYKVLCSSASDELTWGFFFSESFVRGCGWDIDQKGRTAMPADTDGNHHITFKEICEYVKADVYKLAQKIKETQHVVYYPEGDETILF